MLVPHVSSVVDVDLIEEDPEGLLAVLRASTGTPALGERAGPTPG